MLGLAGSAGATDKASEGIHRLASSEAVTFQSNIGPCIDVPAGTADGSLNDAWSLALQSAHNDEVSSSIYDLDFKFNFFGDIYGDGATSPNDKVYINENRCSDFDLVDFPFDGTAIIAPSWSDVDTSANHGHVWLKDLSSISDRNVLAVTCENVGYWYS
jgi:hypothetical protein